MTAAYWVYAAFIAFGTLITISTVGKPRKPLEGNVAALVVVIQLGLIYLLVTAALA